MVYNICNRIDHDALSAFCCKHHIRKLSLFGSVLRDELSPQSDIDLLIEFEKGYAPGLIGLAGMEIELTTILGRKTDLRTPRDLSRHIRKKILQEAQVQYEKA